MGNMGPIKIHDAPSKVRQFLIDIEFNSSPTMNMSQGGVVLQNHEITAINSVMGEQGIYQDKLREIMKDANRLTYTGPDGVTHKGFINIIKAQRRGLVPSEMLDSGKYANIYSRIRRAYADAKRNAENSLPDQIRAGINLREYEKLQSDRNQKAGNIDELILPTR